MSIHPASGQPGTWEQGLFSVGDCMPCMYACCCTSWAVAESKSIMDGSQCLANYVFLNCISTRWLIRSAYKIPGTAMEDCMIGCCCSPCAANQMYQTTFKKGNPFKHTGGFHMNDGTYMVKDTCNCSNCLYSTCCFPCAVGTGLETAMGMPFMMGCCFVNACGASQLMRYHYRIKGSDVGMDLVVPYALCAIGHCLSSFTCGASYGLIFPYTIGLIMGLLSETKARKAASGGDANTNTGYIVGYVPTSATTAHSNNHGNNHQHMVAPMQQMVPIHHHQQQPQQQQQMQMVPVQYMAVQQVPIQTAVMVEK